MKKLISLILALSLGISCLCALSEDAGLGYDVYGTDRMRGGRLITICESDPWDIGSEHVYLKDIPSADWVDTEVDDF